MADIFNAAGKVGGIFKGTTVKVTYSAGNAGGGSGGALTGALVQSLSINYSRNISRIWELGSDDTYYVVGHTEGQASLSRIIGKADLDILDKMADVCEAKNGILSVSGTADTCDNGNGQPNFSVRLIGPVLVNVGMSVDANQFMITSQAGLMFSGLEKQRGSVA